MSSQAPSGGDVAAIAAAARLAAEVWASRTQGQSPTPQEWVEETRCWTGEIKTTDQVRSEFNQSGTGIIDWAQRHGFSLNLVYAVLHGRALGKRGASHDIAVCLGLKRGVASIRVAKAPERASAPIRSALRQKNAVGVVPKQTKLKTTQQVKAEFEESGKSILDWCSENRVKPYAAYRVLAQDKVRAKRGELHRAAVLLGLKHGRAE